MTVGPGGCRENCAACLQRVTLGRYGPGGRIARATPFAGFAGRRRGTWVPARALLYASVFVPGKPERGRRDRNEDREGGLERRGSEWVGLG